MERGAIVNQRYIPPSSTSSQSPASLLPNQEKDNIKVSDQHSLWKVQSLKHASIVSLLGGGVGLDLYLVSLVITYALCVFNKDCGIIAYVCWCPIPLVKLVVFPFFHILYCCVI